MMRLRQNCGDLADDLRWSAVGSVAQKSFGSIGMVFELLTTEIRSCSASTLSFVRFPA